MRKFVPFLCVVAVLILAGCNLSTQQTIRNHAHNKTQLGALIDSLVEHQPFFKNNIITRANFADSLAKRFLQYKNMPLPYLKGIPMKYEMGIPYSMYGDMAGKYVVKFSYYEYGYSENKLSENCTICFQVFTIMTKETMSGLIDGANFSISGTFRGFCNEMHFPLPSGNFADTSPPHVDTSSSTIYDEVMVDIGTLVLDDVKYVLTK